MEGNTVINFSEKHHLIHPTSTRRGDKSQPGTLEHVFAIEEDSEGNIWFGDRDTGAWKYDGKKLVNYQIDPKLNAQMIWSIYEDQNKNLLFGMAGGGVYKFNGKTLDKQF
ncbi:two-component regulator propeller domain-containing protein [Pedobacter sp.]|uniref:two-component regulator propeller domain-containing protein n=1 Tax=Pedobacter sp. TaxID=1411316 RepID=UPI0031D102FA